MKDNDIAKKPDSTLAKIDVDSKESAQFDSDMFLKSLTRHPGVYRMKDAGGQVLYIGKARNLKARVTSYFRAAGLASKTMALVSRVADIDTIVTTSEMEALLLEQSLIKQEKPPYNVVLRDDKSYPFIRVTDHKHPRLSLHRGAKRGGGRYFGPYPSAGSVRDSIHILQKLFGIRSCEDGFYKNRSRPCLQHQIGRCTAPCVEAISTPEYFNDVELAVQFLEGKSGAVLASFREKMEIASKNLEFEDAARYRDQINQLRRIQEDQFVHTSSGDVDIFGISTIHGYACVNCLFVRGGQVLGHRSWYPKNQLSDDVSELLSAFLAQYYLGSKDRDIPKQILTSENLPDANVISEALSSRLGRKVKVASNVRTQRARWIEMAKQNAIFSVKSMAAEKKNIFSRFVELQDALGLEDLPQRLECFDISHSSGEAAVASCVVFDTNGPLKSEYRRFNIEGIVGGDDYGAMEQALRRRYERVKSGEGLLPNVIVIDGGKGQVARAAQVLFDLQIDDVILMGIAKGPTRKAGRENFIIHGSAEYDPMQTKGATLLLQQIRDEAHRFAVAGHRGRRQRVRRKSELDAIPGIGPKRKRELLVHFGSIQAIKGVGPREIAKVAGISIKLAHEIYGALHAA